MKIFFVLFTICYTCFFQACNFVKSGNVLDQFEVVHVN